MASDYSLQIEGSIDVPHRTAYIDDPDYTDQAFTITGVARKAPGDTLDITSEAPSGDSYQIELLDRQMNTVDFSDQLTGDASVTFDTSGLEPGTYGVVPIKNETAQAVFPVVLRAYDVTIQSPTNTLNSGGDLTVQADVTQQVSGESINAVRLFLTSESGDTNGERTMEQSGGLYEETFPDLGKGEYVYLVAVEGTEQVDLSVDGSFFIDSNFNEAIGHSDVIDLSVGLSDKLVEKWTPVDRNGRLQFSTAALNTDLAFVGGLDESFVAIRRSDGTQKWSKTRAGALADSSPALSSGTVYVGSGGGVLYAYDASSGSEQWTYTTDSAIVSSPTVANGSVYVGSNDGTVISVDASGGAENWTTDVGAGVLSKPAYDSGTLYVTTDDGFVRALDTANNGSQLWQFDAGTGFGHASPVYDSNTGYVFVAADDVIALDPANNGSEVWRTPHGGFSESSPIVVGGSVYVGADDGDLVSLKASDGTPEWVGSTTEPVEATPAVVSSRVIVPSTDGKIYVFDESNGTEILSKPIGSTIRSSPVVDNTEVYFGDEGGNFYALENIP